MGGPARIAHASTTTTTHDSVAHAAPQFADVSHAHDGRRLPPLRSFNNTRPLLLLLFFLFTVVVGSSLLPLGRTERTHGHLYTDSSKPWTYLAKFCVAPAGGYLNITAVPDLSQVNATQVVTIYDDAQWDHVYKNDDLSCAEKVSYAVAACPCKTTSGSVIADCSTCSYLLSSTTSNEYLRSIRVNSLLRARWFYMAISNCGGAWNGDDAPVAVSSYQGHFVNNGDRFKYEFSYDEFGIFQMCICFLGLYSILLLVLAWIKRHAKQKGLQYVVVKFLFASVLVEWIGLLFNLIHYAKYSSDGTGVPELNDAYFFFEFVADLILLYAVLNVSKGWTISTNYIPDRRITYLGIFVLFLLYIAVFVWTRTIMDPAAVLYMYATPPGYAVVGIRAALTLWVVFYVIRTFMLEKARNKRQFYLVWLVFASLWLASLPVIVGVASVLDSWVRQSIVFGLTTSVQAVIYLALTYLFRPFRSNRYFDVLRPDEQRAFGTNTQQIFPGAPGDIQFSTF